MFQQYVGQKDFIKIEFLSLKKLFIIQSHFIIQIQDYTYKLKMKIKSMILL
jgi:hypothetical protein